MLGIVFTTTDDARPVLQSYTGDRFDAVEAGTPIRLGEALVVVAGPGKINAALATERLLRDYEVDTVTHIGGCAPLTDEVSPPQMMGVSFVLEGDRVELDAPTYPRMPLDCPFDVSFEGTLVSQDHTDPDDDQGYWARLADARDETGYAVAYVAAQHGVPCHIGKVAVASSPDDTGQTGAPVPEEAVSSMTDLMRQAIENHS